MVRVGPNWIYPGRGGSESSTPLFVAPEPSTVTKSSDEFKNARKNLKPGTFRDVVVGPEGGASDGQS